jgi:hypothetical protein
MDPVRQLSNPNVASNEFTPWERGFRIAES